MPTEPDARRFHRARLVDAGGDEHRVVTRAQIGEGYVAAELEIRV